MSKTLELFENIQNNLNEAVFEIDYSRDGDLSTEESIINNVKEWLGDLANQIKVEVKNIKGPAGGWPEIRLIGDKETIGTFLNQEYNSGEEQTLEDTYALYLLKESDEVPYCDDVNCEPIKEENNLSSDPKFYEYVKSLLNVGAMDDPKYVESLNNEDFDALVKSWMKDPQIIDDYKTYVLDESSIPEDPIKDDVKNDLGIESGSDEEQMLDNLYNEDEKPQGEPVNDFEQLSPEVQEALNEMASGNSMYKWVIDDVMDSDISGYDGDTVDEKLKSRLEEIIEHGCESGTVSSLIYYTDTVKFFDNFNDEIYDMIEDIFGAESTLEMLQRHCELIDIIMGADVVKNYLAWMAYEITCSNILDSIESM